AEGYVLDALLQSRRNKKAALRLMRKLLKRQGVTPRVMVNDKLRSYLPDSQALALAGSVMTAPPSWPDDVAKFSKSKCDFNHARSIASFEDQRNGSPDIHMA
ncbi:hypothetical protein Rleg10DRAFT_3562, partial [Rhizobium leguminosarum bv. trifolii WSM2012]